MVRPGELLQVAGDPVRVAQLGGLRDDPGEVAELGQQGRLARVVEQRRVEPVLAAHAGVGGVLPDVAGAGVRVLHVEHRVLVAPLDEQVEVEVDHRVHRRAREGVPRGVDADGLHQVLHRHHGAGALGHPDGLAGGHEVDHLPDEDLEVHVRGVAERGAHRHHPADVPVVVGPEHDDHPVEPALALVQVVRQVARDVGGLAVGLDDHPVLVVAEVRGAQPRRAVGLEDVAQLAQAGDGALDRPGLVEGVLVEVHLEVDPEAVQRRLDLAEHELDAACAEDLLRDVVGQGERVRLACLAAAREHGVGDVGDVLAAVAVLRRLLPLGPGEQGPGEPVDLGAVVVEVVLARHLGAARGDQPGEGVADGGPPGATDVDGPGRVRGHELQVHALAGQRRRRPVRSSRLDDGARELARGRRVQRDVQEARPRDVDARDAGDRGQALGQQVREVARRDTRLLAQLERDVGRPVAVLARARSLHRHHGRQVGRIQGQGAVGHGGDQDGAQGVGELGGGHRESVSAPRVRPVGASVTRPRSALRAWKGARGRASGVDCLSLPGRWDDSADQPH